MLRIGMRVGSLNSSLREIGHGVGGFHEFFKGGHYARAGEEFAEEFDFAAEFLVRDGLDEFFGGGTGDGVEFGDLCGGGAGDFQGFALGGELRDEADGLRIDRKSTRLKSTHRSTS